MIFNLFKTASEIMFNKKVSGMSATNVQDAIDYLNSYKLEKGTTSPEYIGIYGINAKGSSTSVTLAKNTITTIPLNTWDADTDSRDTPTCYSFTSDGGILINESGYYLVGGSVYINCNAITGSNLRSVYLYKGSTEVASNSENTYGSNSTHIGGLGFTPRLLSLNSGDKLYLKARTQQVAGTANAANAATYLTLVRVGW